MRRQQRLAVELDVRARARPRPRRGGSRGSGATGWSSIGSSNVAYCRTWWPCPRAPRSCATVMTPCFANASRTSSRTSASSAMRSAQMSRAPASAAADVGHLLLGASTKRRGLVRGIAARPAAPDALGERLEAALLGDRSRACGASACTAGRGPRARPWSRTPGSAPRARAVSLPCSAIAARIALAPLLELDQVGAALLDGADLHLVEPAGGLLAVARDERDRGALVRAARRRRRRRAAGARARGRRTGRDSKAGSVDTRCAEYAGRHAMSRALDAGVLDLPVAASAVVSVKLCINTGTFDQEDEGPAGPSISSWDPSPGGGNVSTL